MKSGRAQDARPFVKHFRRHLGSSELRLRDNSPGDLLVIGKEEVAVVSAIVSHATAKKRPPQR